MSIFDYMQEKQAIGWLFAIIGIIVALNKVYGSVICLGFAIIFWYMAKKEKLKGGN